MQAQRFLDAIKNDLGNCVLVVGSGLSKKDVRKGGAGLPDWNQLMNLMISHLSESSRCKISTIKQLRSMLTENPPRYLDIAEVFYKEHENDPDGYELFLHKHLDPPDLVDSKVHKVILELGFMGIVSYNFDMVFEKQSNIPSKLVYPHLLEQIGNFRRKGFFAKIRGCISGPAKQLILTRTSFEQLAADAQYRQLIETIFLSHVVLCVGFSLLDPDFQSILSDLKNCWGAKMPVVYALVCNPSQKVISDWLKKGVDILPYNDHHEILGFFCSLSNRDRKVNKKKGNYKMKTGKVPLEGDRFLNTDETRSFILNALEKNQKYPICRHEATTHAAGSAIASLAIRTFLERIESFTEAFKARTLEFMREVENNPAQLSYHITSLSQANALLVNILSEKNGKSVLKKTFQGAKDSKKIYRDIKETNDQLKRHIYDMYRVFKEIVEDIKQLAESEKEMEEFIESDKWSEKISTLYSGKRAALFGLSWKFNGVVESLKRVNQSVNQDWKDDLKQTWEGKYSPDHRPPNSMKIKS